jgi:hypothetical protein
VIPVVTTVRCRLTPVSALDANRYLMSMRPFVNWPPGPSGHNLRSLQEASVARGRTSQSKQR